MPDDLYYEAENHMLYSRPENIPLFKLTSDDGIRRIDFKSSSHCTRRKNKKEDKIRSEKMKLTTFVAMLVDEARWCPGKLFYTPKYHLPMFRMIEICGEHYIEVMNQITKETATIKVIEIFVVLLDDNVWNVA